MLELGEESAAYHDTLGKHIVQAGVDLVIGVGKDVYHTIDRVKKLSKTAAAFHFYSNEDAILFLREEIQHGDCVLVKGSRGMKLDEIVQVLSLHFHATQTSMQNI